MASPTNFDPKKLAEKIAAHSGVKLETFKVKAVGKEEVEALIKRMEVSRSTPPPSRLKVK